MTPKCNYNIFGASVFHTKSLRDSPWQSRAEKQHAAQLPPTTCVNSVGMESISHFKCLLNLIAN